MLLPLIVGAQEVPATVEVSTAKSEYRHVQAKANLAENQLIMGHYDSDSLSEQGVGMSNSSSYLIAVMLQPEELEVFNGGRIVAFRVGLVEPAQVSKVFVVPVSATGRFGSRISWNCEFSSVGWNEVQLETPYDINLAEGEKLMIGFSYRQELDAHPLSAVKEGIPYDAYTYVKSGSSGKWKSVGMTDIGNLSVQCIVENDKFPDYKMTSYGLSSIDYAKAGEELPFSFHINNKGLKSIDGHALVTRLLIDGEQVATIDNNEAFDHNYLQQGSISTDGLESGDHVLTVQLATLNGEEIENAQTHDWAFRYYQRDFPRQQHLVEQLTSTYCTFCPQGNSMLSYLTSQREDVIWVGIHGNLNGGVDKFRTVQGDSIMIYLTGGSIGYPSAAFDRSTGWSDDVNIINVISYGPDVQQLAAYYLGDFFDYIAAATPTFAEIKADCDVDQETREATIKIHGSITPDFDVMMGEDAKLTVYLVEDSLAANQLSSGVWIKDYIHNGVFRKALGSVLGVKVNRVDDYYENTFTVTIPQAWNMSNMRVVAFISRPLSNFENGFTDMYVNNAASFSLLSHTGGIEELLITGDAVPVEYYDMMGRQTSGLHPGINLIKMSDGAVKKVLVK